MHYVVPAVERAIKALNYLKGLGPEDKRSLVELCRALDVPRSSAINIMRTLETYGYVQRDPESGKYGLGWALVSLGVRASESVHREKELLHPILIGLQRETGITSVLARAVDDQAVIVDKSEGSRQPRATISVGQSDPLDAGAHGQVFMAYLTERELQAYLDRRSLPAYTDHSIVNRDDFLCALALVRQRGYATDDQQYHLGVNAVGAPVFDAWGRVELCIFVLDLASSLPSRAFAAVGARVRACAQGMTSALGGVWPEGERGSGA